jgi:hypothetical protein
VPLHAEARDSCADVHAESRGKLGIPRVHVKSRALGFAKTSSKNGNSRMIYSGLSVMVMLPLALVFVIRFFQEGIAAVMQLRQEVSLFEIDRADGLGERLHSQIRRRRSTTTFARGNTLSHPPKFRTRSDGLILSSSRSTPMYIGLSLPNAVIPIEESL